MIRSLFNISDLKRSDLLKIISLKNNSKILENKCIGLIFEKYSTRTRISFNVGIAKLGGTPIDINFNDLNIKRNESFQDTFKALSCYLDGLIYRTSDHKNLEEASKYFNKPIINALSDLSHPCQIISDLFTLKEQFGSLDLNILWIGDLNNVCFSFCEAAEIIEEFKFTICSHEQILEATNFKKFKNTSFISSLNNLNLELYDCIMTDVYVSMNDKNFQNKEDLLSKYQVNAEIMDKTKDDCVFMHCLPAKVGSEVTEDVLNSNKSIVWKQAQNRMVAQNKLLQCIDW